MSGASGGRDAAAAAAAIPGKPFRTMLRLSRPHARRLAAGAALAVVFTAAGLATPLIIREMVRGISGGSIGGAGMARLFVLLLAVSLAAGVVRYFQRVLMIGASRQVEYDLRNAYFRRIQGLSAPFFHRVPTGDLMARATSDMNHVRDFFDCIRSRRPTVANPEVMYRSMNICLAADICEQLKRNLKFDLIHAEFVGDGEANRMRCRAMRAPFTG